MRQWPASRQLQLRAAAGSRQQRLPAPRQELPALGPQSGSGRQPGRIEPVPASRGGPKAGRQRGLSADYRPAAASGGRCRRAPPRPPRR